MSQKTIPLSLRLYKKKNWNSQYIVEKNNYSNFLFLNLEIQKYFEIILKDQDLKILNININKSSKNIYIYIYIHKHPKIKLENKIKTNQFKFIIKNLNLLFNNEFLIKFLIINVTTKNLQINQYQKKLFKLLEKNYQLNFNFKRIIYSLISSLACYDFSSFLKLLKQNLQRKKIHLGYIKFINKILETFLKIYSNNFLGYKIQIKGRVNGAKRSKKYTFQNGKIPLNTLKYNINYTFNEFNTKSGICSLKMWVFLKEK